MMEKQKLANVSGIDAQHEQLSELVNQMCETLKTDCAKNDVTDQLEKLLDFTKAHFTEEEALMMRYRYKELTSHKNIHQTLSDKLIQFNQKILTLFDQECKSKLIAFLTTEFKGHVVDDIKAWQEGEINTEFLYQRLEEHEVPLNEPISSSKEYVSETETSALTIRGLPKTSKV